MELPDLEIDYRFSSRRRSIGLTVTAHGKVVVTAPTGTPPGKIAQALDRHRAWIYRKVAERRAAWSRLRDGLAFFLGQPYRLETAPGNGRSVEIAGNRLRVPVPEGGAAVRWKRLVAWYRGQADVLISQRLRHYGARMGLAAGPMELRSWKRRWGECHPDGLLRFNWRLVLLPPEIVDYVVVHELAHLLVPGHNPRFWSVVAGVLPDWARRRRWLNREGSPFLLWRA
jgi:predicted metal-dependent hydrolase